MAYPAPIGERRDHIASLMYEVLGLIGEDPKRSGLKDTPNRIAKAYTELCAGYSQDPKDVVTMFESDGYDQMVLLRDIPFYSLCEHHMLPFVGKAAIGYIPDGRILGLSKLARLLEIYARRLQVQERLTKQIADALDTDPLHPKGVIVVVEAEHLCMTMRGVQRPGSMTVTSELRGDLLDDPKSRAEAMSLITGR